MNPSIIVKDALEKVNFLLDAGIAVNSRNNQGWTVLMDAVACKRTELVDFLLKKGADPNAVAKNKDMTPLKIAQKNGYEEIINLLVNAGAKE